MGNQVAEPLVVLVHNHSQLASLQSEDHRSTLTPLNRFTLHTLVRTPRVKNALTLRSWSEGIS
jgi:hypothetical protein